jgi:hypothetical protein
MRHLALALFLTLAACKKDPPEIADAKTRAAAVDKEIAEDLGGPKSSEARAWLAKPTSMGFKASVHEMSELTDAIYAAGAPQVYVVGVSDLGGREVAAVLAVALPADAASRKQVFDWHARWAASVDEKPAIDVGQRYLKVVLD